APRTGWLTNQAKCPIKWSHRMAAAGPHSRRVARDDRFEQGLRLAPIEVEAAPAVDSVPGAVTADGRALDRERRAISSVLEVDAAAEAGCGVPANRRILDRHRARRGCRVVVDSATP